MDTNISSIPYTYVIQTSSAIAANGTTTLLLQLQADSQFELETIYATSSLDVNSDVSSNNFSVQMSDQSTGRLFSNGRVPQRVFAGNAFNGELNRRPIVFQPNSIVNFDILNLTANSNTVTIALKGYKILI
jgi:hypothetical protein